jgi:hypothetical protein
MFQLGPLPLKVDFVIHELFILVTGPYRSTYTSRVFGSLLLLAWLALHIQSRTGQVRLTHGQVRLTHATAFRLTHAMASCLVAHTQIAGSDAVCLVACAQPSASFSLTTCLALHACLHHAILHRQERQLFSHGESQAGGQLLHRSNLAQIIDQETNHTKLAPIEAHVGNQTPPSDDMAC